MTSPATEGPDPEGGQEREHGQADEGVQAGQVRPRRPGEGAVGDGVGGEGRASQYHEETDDAGHDGDDGGNDPGVHHEACEHVHLPGPSAGS